MIPNLTDHHLGSVFTRHDAFINQHEHVVTHEQVL